MPVRALHRFDSACTCKHTSCSRFWAQNRPATWRAASERTPSGASRLWITRPSLNKRTEEIMKNNNNNNRALTRLRWIKPVFFTSFTLALSLTQNPPSTRQISNPAMRMTKLLPCQQQRFHLVLHLASCSFVCHGSCSSLYKPQFPRCVCLLTQDCQWRLLSLSVLCVRV